MIEHGKIVSINADKNTIKKEACWFVMNGIYFGATPEQDDELLISARIAKGASIKETRLQRSKIAIN